MFWLGNKKIIFQYALLAGGLLTDGIYDESRLIVRVLLYFGTLANSVDPDQTGAI